MASVPNARDHGPGRTRRRAVTNPETIAQHGPGPAGLRAAAGQLRRLAADIDRPRSSAALRKLAGDLETQAARQSREAAQGE